MPRPEPGWEPHNLPTARPGGGTIPVELSHGISGEVGIRDRREMRMVVGDMLERLVRRSPGKDALVGWAGAYATDDFRRLVSGRDRAWTLLDQEWPPGGDEVTATMKLRRRVIATSMRRSSTGSVAP